jgi:hypothetical protein
MSPSTTYRALLPLSLAVTALVALGGYAKKSSTQSWQPNLPIELIDIGSEHHRRLNGMPNVNLRRQLKKSAKGDARNPQPEAESLVQESLVENDFLFKTSEVTTECPTPLTPPPLPGKKGIGLKLNDEEKNMPKVVALNPYWNYSWGPKRVESQPDNIEFVPMLWGAWGDTGLVNRIVADVIPQIESGQAKRALAFNEPDHPKQSNMSVEDVVSYWHILEDINLPLASPSVAQSTGSWMMDFMEEAEANCLRMEYVAIHWYGGASVEEFKNKMRVTYEMYGSRRPLLLTEFAPADWTALTPADNKWSQANVLAFMKEVLPWLEEQDWIEGYAWFSFEQSFAAGTSSALFDLNGDQTTIGKFYASVTTDNPAGDQSITV